MNLPRRRLLPLTASAVTLPAVSRFACAQGYPTRAVHLVEGFGAGGAPDIVARLIGQSLSERLGQVIVVENRSGASGTIATEAVVRAAPDGYTLLLVTTANAVNATLFKLSFDFIRDIAPVAGIGLVAHRYLAIHHRQFSGDRPERGHRRRMATAGAHRGERLGIVLTELFPIPVLRPIVDAKICIFRKQQAHPVGVSTVPVSIQIGQHGAQLAFLIFPGDGRCCGAEKGSACQGQQHLQHCHLLCCSCPFIPA